MERSRLPADWPRRRLDLRVAGVDLALEVPDQPYSLLDLSSVEEAFEQDEYMPYWAHLWPGAFMLGEWLIRTAAEPDQAEAVGLPLPPADVLEVGCGLAVTGLLAAKAGYRVTCSDYDRDAMEYVRFNAGLNGLAVRTRAIDWREPPLDRFPLILAADVLYEARNHLPLFEFFRLSLAPGGLVAMSDPNRRTADAFVHDATAHGWIVRIEPARWEDSTGRVISMKRR